MSDDSTQDKDAPVKIWVHDFEEADVRKLEEGVSECLSREQKFVPVYINTLGGDVWGLFAMIDIIRACTIPVVTIVVGKALSAGCDLLAAGTHGYRFAAPNATIMMHESIEQEATPIKLQEFRNRAREAMRLDAMGFAMLEKHCRKPKGYFRKLIAKRTNTDWFMGPAEAKRHGIIDHIGMPIASRQTESNVVLQMPAGNEKKRKTK